MYINFEYLVTAQITDKQLLTLCKIQQNAHSLIEEDQELQELIDTDMLQYKAKGKNKRDLKLTTRAKDFLKKVTTPNLTDEIAELAEELVNSYTAYSKPHGKELVVRERLVQFVAQTGFNSEVIKTAVEDYLAENSEYTLNLENLIWKPESTAFSVHFKLKDSRLFDEISRKYSLKQDKFLCPEKGKKDKYLYAISKLEPPKKDAFYFTGSYKTDQEHINNAKLEIYKRRKR